MKNFWIYFVVPAILTLGRSVFSSITCRSSYAVGTGRGGSCNVTASLMDIPDKRDILRFTCGPSAPTHLQCGTYLQKDFNEIMLKWQSPNDASATRLSGFQLVIPTTTDTLIVRCPKQAYLPLNTFTLMCQISNTTNMMDTTIVLSSLPTSLKQGCNTDCFYCGIAKTKMVGPDSCSKFTPIVLHDHEIYRNKNLTSSPPLYFQNEDNLKNGPDGYNKEIKETSFGTSSRDFSNTQWSTTYAPEPSVNKNAYKFSKSMDYVIGVVVAFLVVSGALGAALVYKFRKEIMRWASAGFQHLHRQRRVSGNAASPNQKKTQEDNEQNEFYRVESNKYLNNSTHDVDDVQRQRIAMESAHTESKDTHNHTEEARINQIHLHETLPSEAVKSVHRTLMDKPRCVCVSIDQSSDSGSYTIPLRHRDLPTNCRVEHSCIDRSVYFKNNQIVRKTCCRHAQTQNHDMEVIEKQMLEINGFSPCDKSICHKLTKVPRSGNNPV